jgi:cation diffusion facilitator family transporter
VAARPPDDDHPYGHHKAEYFSSGFEGVLILGAALAIIWAAVQRLLDPQPLEAVGLGLVLSVVSSALNGALAWACCARRAPAPLDGAGSRCRHLFTDVWTSAGVVWACWRALATGWLWLDPLIAIAVAATSCARAFAWCSGSADGLMDHALEPDQQRRDRAHPGRLRPRGDPLRPCAHAKRRAAGASWTCTCTCRRAGRSAALRPCGWPSSRR